MTDKTLTDCICKPLKLKKEEEDWQSYGLHFDLYEPTCASVAPTPKF